MDEEFPNSPQQVFRTFLRNQRKNITPIGSYDSMNFFECLRINRFIRNANIFSDNCIVFDNKNKKNNKNYISVSYNGKKVSLLKLLYINFVDDIPENKHIKYLCDHGGLCLSLKHITFV